MRRLFPQVVLLLGFILLASGAYADTISIGLQSGNGTITNETGAGNNCGTGCDTLSSATVGGFTVQSVTAIDGSTPPDFTVNGGLEKSTSTGTFSIYVSDQGLTAATAGNFSNAWGITTVPAGWTVTITTYVDTANGLFTTTCGTCTQVGTATFTGNGSNSSWSNLMSLTGTFSETMKITFTVNTADSTATSIVGGAETDFVPAPEPSSLLLLGTGLVGFAKVIAGKALS